MRRGRRRHPRRRFRRPRQRRRRSTGAGHPGPRPRVRGLGLLHGRTGTLALHDLFFLLRSRYKTLVSIFNGVHRSIWHERHEGGQPWGARGDQGGNNGDVQGAVQLTGGGEGGVLGGRADGSCPNRDGLLLRRRRRQVLEGLPEDVRAP